MARKQRRRPDAGMYEDEHYRADIIPSPAGPTIEIYSKPHHDLLFKASQEGLKINCKLHKNEHLLSWSVYPIRLLGAPLYHVTCMDGRTLIHALNVIFRDPQNGADGAYNMLTLTSNDIELIDKLRDAFTSEI
jgi:hypothetical protein